jgi:hypothetical protein
MSDLFDMDLDAGMAFLSKKENKKNDGLLRLDPKTSKNPTTKGLRVVMRFLPNLSEDGKVGVAAIEKHVHYVKLPNHQHLVGYFDSMRNFNLPCDLTNTYWELKNSKSVIDNEKADLISRSTKYYSYVQILEHETEPDLVGKIMIFPFGIKIKNKINEERTGEITGSQVNVYDLANGKDFICIVKEIGGFANYDSSMFKPLQTPIQIVAKDGSLKEVPTVDVNGRKAIDPKFQDKIKEYLLSREVALEDYAPVKWDEETRSKVNEIVSILKNSPVVAANKAISNAKTGDDTFFEDDALPFGDNTTTPSSSKSEDDFFNF